ncbi:MAG: FGGY family carbohydrate kinase, partial [Actinomycetales bacterium]
MNPRRAILAIDQGTSATKAVVWADELLAEVDVPVEGLVFTGDAVEQDPQALLASVVQAGQQAIASAAERAPIQITAVGVGNQGETVLAWDPCTGRTLSSAISWQDRRAQSVTEAL